MKKQEKLVLSAAQLVWIAEYIANKDEDTAIEYVKQYKQGLKDKKQSK